MTLKPSTLKRRGAIIAALIFVQSICVAFFLVDVIHDLAALPLTQWISLYLSIELAANLALIAGIVFEGFYLRHLLRRQAQAERAISVASGALHEVMEDYFEQWGLTPAEADIASFTVKGFSISEIASLRGSAEGTVKTHLNAIYRKSGLAGRGQLVGLLVEELLSGLPPGRGAERGES
ncbi:MAG: LuxR C-terminal-related transcriptional regulator [Albidovulum sp.]